MRRRHRLPTPPPAGPPQLQLVIIPGNPGSAAYFVHFMQQLHDALHGAVDILACTHLGHDPGRHHGSRVRGAALQSGPSPTPLLQPPGLQRRST